MTSPVEEPHAEARTLTVSPDAASVRRARHEVDRWLRERGKGDADTAALLLSELLTNVVLHARTTATVNITLDTRCLRVVVSDGAPGLPARRRPEPASVTGRGLMIVDAMSDAWGIDQLPAGKSVWFELSLDGHEAST